MLTKVACSIIVGCGLTSVAGFSQTAVLNDTYLTQKSFAVEAKPIPFVMNFVPGITSLGVGAELSERGYHAAFINGYLIDSNLPSGLRNSTREDDVPVLQKINGYSADLGYRYYTGTLRDDSWYGGAKVGYSIASSQWGYQSEQVNSSVRTVTPGVEGGYRWLWSNNVLLRLGAGVDSNIIQENTASALNEATPTTVAAGDKIQGYAQVAVLPRADFGLGYSF